MRALLKSFGTSKKFLVLIAGIAAISLVDPEQAKLITGLVMAYLGSQGMSDFGKEKK